MGNDGGLMDLPKTRAEVSASRVVARPSRSVTAHGRHRAPGRIGQRLERIKRPTVPHVCVPARKLNLPGLVLGGAHLIVGLFGCWSHHSLRLKHTPWRPPGKHEHRRGRRTQTGEFFINAAPRLALKLLVAERPVRCPLSGVKRTSRTQVQMSAFDPKRTSKAG